MAKSTKKRKKRQSKKIKIIKIIIKAFFSLGCLPFFFPFLFFL